MSQVSRIVFSIVKMAKAIVWIVKIAVNCQKLSKLSKIVKIVKNCQKCTPFSRHSANWSPSTITTTATSIIRIVTPMTLYFIVSIVLSICQMMATTPTRASGSSEVRMERRIGPTKNSSLEVALHPLATASKYQVLSHYLSKYSGESFDFNNPVTNGIRCGGLESLQWRLKQLV